VCKLIAIAVLLGMSMSAAQDKLEDMVYIGGQVTIRLSQADCEIPGLGVALMANGALTPPKTAVVTRYGAEVRACWALDADSDVLVRDEMGTGGYLPMSAFRPASPTQRNRVTAPAPVLRFCVCHADLG